MNVLYVGTLPPHPGGTAIVGAQLVAGLAGGGDRVRALAPVTAAGAAAARRFDAAHPRVRVARFRVLHFESSPDQPAGDEYRARETRGVQDGMRELTRAERPDVVVIGRETFAPSVTAVAKPLGLPTVLLAQGATTAGIVRGTLPPAEAEALLTGFREADAIVLVARHLARTYRDLGFADARVIQNGVDLRRFSPGPGSGSLRTSLAIAPGDVVLVHASNLKALKRPLDIVESAEMALVRNPSLLYVIVGDGPLREAMEEECARRGLAHRFRFPGWVDHEEMPEYLRLADLVLMPSETEALALVYLEAMACGVPVLASDIPAAREVIEDGHSGVLFRRADPADLADKTLAAAADPDGRREMGLRAREAAAGHDLARTVAAYCDLFRDVVSRIPSSHG